MHHIIIIPGIIEYTFPSEDIDKVFKLIAHFKSVNVEYTHHFEE